MAEKDWSQVDAYLGTIPENVLRKFKEMAPLLLEDAKQMFGEHDAQKEMCHAEASPDRAGLSEAGREEASRRVGCEDQGPQPKSNEA